MEAVSKEAGKATSYHEAAELLMAEIREHRKCLQQLIHIARGGRPEPPGPGPDLHAAQVPR